MFVYLLIESLQSTNRMNEETIDFGNFTKKIFVNPIVPLQLFNLKCRNSARIQATLLGKIYSSHIEILEIVPVGLCDQNKVKTIDFQEHQRALDNIMNVYPTLQIIGVAVTDLKPDINLAFLHTLYVNKESGFKPQGILLYPIILSVTTTITATRNFHIDAYSYNQVYRFCKDVMEVTAFEKLDVSINFGDTDFQSITPLFEAVNDQDKIVPVGNIEELMVELVRRLKGLKTRCDGEESSSLKVKLREVVDRLNSKHEYSMEELSYLLDLTGLQKRIALKLNKFL